jgi:hypothetical protein
MAWLGALSIVVKSRDPIDSQVAVDGVLVWAGAAQHALFSRWHRTSNR